MVELVSQEPTVQADLVVGVAHERFSQPLCGGCIDGYVLNERGAVAGHAADADDIAEVAVVAAVACTWMWQVVMSSFRYLTSV